MKAVISCLLALLVSPAMAQTYSPLSWGINKAVSPYAFGANINNTWRNLGTISSSGEWRVAPKSLASTDFLRNDSSAPSISIPWGPDTTNGHVWTPFYLGTVASHNDDADSGGIVSFVSSTGYSAAPYMNWKAGFQVFGTGNDGTSNIWSFNPACSLSAGETHGVGCVAIEADLNLSNRNYTGIPASSAGPWAAAVVAAGGGNGHFGHAAYVVNSSNTTTWNYGLMIVDYTTGTGSKSINTADIFSNSKAPYFLQDVGTKSYGLALSGTYAGFAIGIPNNSAVSAVRAGGGGSYDVLYYYDTGNRLIINPKVIFNNPILPAAYVIGTIPACGASNNGVIVVATDGAPYASSYGTAYTGGGTTTRKLLCSNPGGTFTWTYD